MTSRFGLGLLFLLGAAMGLAQTSFSADVLALGPLGYWRLDGNAVDATLHASNGSVLNGLTFTGPGVGTLFDLELMHPFSMMIWVKTNYTAGDMILLAKQENISPFRGFGIMIDNGDSPRSSPKNAGRFGMFLSDGPQDFVLVDTLT